MELSDSMKSEVPMLKIWDFSGTLNSTHSMSSSDQRSYVHSCQTWQQHVETLQQHVVTLNTSSYWSSANFGRNFETRGNLNFQSWNKVWNMRISCSSVVLTCEFTRNMCSRSCICKSQIKFLTHQVLKIPKVERDLGEHRNMIFQDPSWELMIWELYVLLRSCNCKSHIKFLTHQVLKIPRVERDLGEHGNMIFHDPSWL